MSDTFAIELKGVTKVFGQIVANKDVNLQVKKGEILAILGDCLCAACLIISI